MIKTLKEIYYLIQEIKNKIIPNKIKNKINKNNSKINKIGMKNFLLTMITNKN